MKLVSHCQDIDTEDTLDLYSMLNFSIMQISLSPLVITAFFEFLHVWINFIIKGNKVSFTVDYNKTSKNISAIS